MSETAKNLPFTGTKYCHNKFEPFKVLLHSTEKDSFTAVTATMFFPGLFFLYFEPFNSPLLHIKSRTTDYFLFSSTIELKFKIPAPFIDWPGGSGSTTLP